MLPSKICHLPPGNANVLISRGGFADTASFAFVNDHYSLIGLWSAAASRFHEQRSALIGILQHSCSADESSAGTSI